ncbi:MAG TPA: hypothetical protein EYH50_03510 [Pyrodictium delaneyi]|uniref:Uncharacterized protein n=1 Tax=Pyrodictium delaneyi TaxID=1273541 RepID=A0A832ZTE7_9CREN|nr:hypothetical protein [Pyrodictium delaneyi]
MIAYAYSGMLPPSATISFIQGITLLVIVATLILSSLDILPSLRRVLVLFIAVFHLTYIRTYTATYDLQLVVKPLFDVFIDRGGRASAMLDLAQIAIASMLVDFVYTRYMHSKNKEKNINP